MGKRNGWTAETLAKLADVSDHNRKSLEAVRDIQKKAHKHNAEPVYTCPYCWTPVQKKDETGIFLNCLCNVKNKDLLEYFDSSGELRRWCDLTIQQKAGHISGLVRQERIPIHVNGVHVGDYVCDFSYIAETLIRIGDKTEGGTPVQVYEDFKGHDTPLSKFKRKCVEASQGITITLTRRS